MIAVAITQDAMRALLPERGAYRTSNMDRLAYVLWLRFCTEPRPTYAAIAAELGVSRGRPAQMIRAALPMLRHPRSRVERVLRVAAHGTDLHAVLIGCPADTPCWWRNQDEAP